MDNDNNMPQLPYIPKGTFEAMRIANDYQHTFKLQAELLNQSKPMIDAVNEAWEPLKNMQTQIDAVQKMVEAASTQMEYINNTITQSYLEQLKQVADPKIIEELNLMGEAIKEIVPLGWPYSKKYTRRIYLVAFNMLEEVSEENKEEELNQFFIEAVEEFILPAIHKVDLQHGLGKDWDATTDYLLEQIQQKNLFSAIPILLICIEWKVIFWREKCSI